MSERNDGGQAFPCADGEYFADFKGMTLRDWFAGQALAGLYAGLPDGFGMKPSQAAEQSYEIADAMIAERSK